MDLHQLRVLRELADHGSIAATARALSVTPSAVSQVVASLQRQFATPLTHKRGRSIELTSAGQALAAAAVAVASAVAQAEASVDAYLGDLSASVRVSGFHSAAVTFFPALAALSSETDHPPVECVDEDVARDAFPVLTASYDLVIAHRMSHTPPWPTQQLSVVPLLQEPVDVAMRTDHPLARRAQLCPEDLVDLPFVSTHTGFSPADLLESIAASAGRPMRVVHRINDFTTAAAMVAQGNLVALLPRYTAAPPKDSGVTLRPLGEVRALRNIDALMRPEHAIRQGVSVVLQSLQQIARTLVQSAHAPEFSKGRP
ncbi:LysR family transcriptional regulator [Streptomyces sp. NBC_01445]|uniref:LysR family transcriptional regulator n=1 Tax=Streptomyces sp. NBC_01445 TaxID=2903869 RepID=UPI002DDB4039|nr:LysR family transcriptional regulator [Streptomyces sp. NBC_01445]WSE11248.1 LysR family transcriptional regulator [Streptomyces sp. NBC_01445]